MQKKLLLLKHIKHTVYNFAPRGHENVHTAKRYQTQQYSNRLLHVPTTGYLSPPHRALWWVVLLGGGGGGGIHDTGICDLAEPSKGTLQGPIAIARDP